ncbi:MotA/TolQ/ExbB proton channel family protein [Shewanella algicola]|uniref:MotA/TolQ/ExbB proton channel family protein n=1 Tax=Shewanella algicola TaxID=640633 RepID=A0A9X1Z3E9_9GAMM|nr:MotA/TolQ/ExbB proton channel family protein [Shewanella algicola]MCL1104388.1 MotA/TolQ/ExbB proton channel family protein [Shewanella algicola]
MEWLTRGGWMMYPILLCSVVALGVVLERFYVIFIRYAQFPQEQFDKLQDLVKKGDIKSAKEMLKQQSSAQKSIYLAMLNQQDEGSQNKAAELEGNSILFRLKERLSILSTIGSVTPLMGLLGTVFGMIDVFSKLAQMQGAANPGMLADGIWQALLTTAAGMTIAIPVVLFYHFFNRHIENIIHQLQTTANILADQLSNIRSAKNAKNTATIDKNRDSK